MNYASHDPKNKIITKRENTPRLPDCRGRNTCLRPELWLTFLLAQVKSNSQAPGEEFEHTAILVPRRTLVVEKILEEEGVLGDLTIQEFPLLFIPLEEDVLSLELENSFEELYLVSLMPIF